MYIKGNELHLVWCTADVMQQADNDDIKISEEEALRVLEIMLDIHDCNNGTTWEDVNYGINRVLEEREEFEDGKIIK